MLGNKLLNIQFAKYHIWNNKSEGFPNMVLSTGTFNQSLRTEYSEAVNARYTFQLLWVSGVRHSSVMVRVWVVSLVISFSILGSSLCFDYLNFDPFGEGSELTLTGLVHFQDS